MRSSSPRPKGRDHRLTLHLLRTVVVPAVVAVPALQQHHNRSHPKLYHAVPIEDTAAAAAVRTRTNKTTTVTVTNLPIPCTITTTTTTTPAQPINY